MNDNDCIGVSLVIELLGEFMGADIALLTDINQLNDNHDACKAVSEWILSELVSAS